MNIWHMQRHKAWRRMLHESTTCLASGSEAVDIRICEATTAKRDASLEEGEYDANDGFAFTA